MTDINALIASAIPVEPPDDWFRDPGLQHAHPIKVTPEGRVYGHVASWDMDHIGMAFGTRPPKSKTGYAYFKTGEILTAGGNLVPVGQLTLAGGHASLEASASQAIRHYDDTQSAIADVTVGEDMHGIWVAGAVRSNATPEQVRALRASAPSGDWRLINGRLEMVAVCQVNVPGFPITRALAAGGSRMSLVAAGTAPLLAQVLAEQELLQRIERLENLANARAREKMGLVASAARARVDEVRKSRLEHDAKMASLRVRDPKRYAQMMSLVASAPSQAKRDKAASSGHALKDGSFPIETVEDLKNAISSFGRAKNKIAAKRHIVRRARGLGKTDLLPSGWSTTALLAAGDGFEHLDSDFLSSKAAEQPRDTNGRFVQTGAFLRFRKKGKAGWVFGQVIGRKVNADGTMDVRLADSDEVVQELPADLEVIKAILPKNQTENEDDRGITFDEKTKPGTPPPPVDLGTSTPGADPAVVESTGPGSTDGVPFKVGQQVQLKGDQGALGHVTKSDDPGAIEVTDPDGVVSVHDSSELEPVTEAAPAAPATPAAAPSM